jgi:DNA-binding CsgD family transcriptional regulator
MNPEALQPAPEEPLALAPLPEEDKDERARRAMDLWFRGLSCADIAPVLGVTERCVRSDLARLRQEWGARAERRTVYHLNRILAELALLKREYMAAWQRSCGARVTTDADGQASVVTLSAGDPRYLNGYRECLEREAKLAGCDAPERVQVEAPVKLVGGLDLDKV